jgi:hypothetical protein
VLVGEGFDPLEIAGGDCLIERFMLERDVE